MATAVSTLMVVLAMTQAASGGEDPEFGVGVFIDEDGDGFNDLAPDADGDGIPDSLDPDYVPPRQDAEQTQKLQVLRRPGRYFWFRFVTPQDALWQAFSALFGPDGSNLEAGQGPGVGTGGEGSGTVEGAGFGPGNDTGGEAEGTPGAASVPSRAGGVEQGGEGRFVSGAGEADQSRTEPERSDDQEPGDVSERAVEP
jgi:hypothetical protein